MATEQQDRWVETVLGLHVALSTTEEGGPLGRLKAALKARRGTAEPPDETADAKAARIKLDLRRQQAFSPHSEKLCGKRYAALSAENQKWFDLQLAAARNDTEKKFIRKALAAGNSVADIAAFAGEIRGKDEAWMLNNLMLTADGSGKGIQQQFVMSCQATTVQAVRGALDPVYALKLRKQTGDIAGIRADVTGAMAAEQKALLETRKADGSAGGVAASLHAFEAASRSDRVAGVGRRGVDLLNQNTGATGLKYKTVYIDGAAQRRAAVADIAGKLAGGMPVPLSVGSAEGELMHYVLAVAFSQGPPRQFLIHDPGSGDTLQVAEDDILANRMRLPSGWNVLNKYEQPNKA